MDLVKQKQLEDLYISKLLPPAEEPKPTTIGQKIMSGMEGALKYLNTGQGGQLTALLAKNPDVQDQIVRQSRAKIPLEAAAQSEANKLDVEKTKSIGELLAQQARNEQQDKILKQTLTSSAEESKLDREARESESKQKMLDEIAKTSRDEQMNTIEKSGLSTDEKLKAKKMILEGLTPKTKKNLLGNLSFGLLGSKEKLDKKQQTIYIDAKGNKAIKNPDGTYTEIP